MNEKYCRSFLTHSVHFTMTVVCNVKTIAGSKTLTLKQLVNNIFGKWLSYKNKIMTFKNMALSLLSSGERNRFRK